MATVKNTIFYLLLLFPIALTNAAAAKTKILCRFTEPIEVSEKTPAFGPALSALARLSDARMTGDPVAVETIAKELAGILSRYSVPSHGRAMLDVIRRLDFAGMDAGARATFRHYLALLDPVSRQSSETATGHLANYLQAHSYVYDANGEDRLKRLRVLQNRLRRGPECFARRFFLRLELARDIGDRHGKAETSPELEELWKDAKALRGVEFRGYPLRWSGYSMLTWEAARFRHFDLAEAWLAETIREADTVGSIPGVSAEIAGDIKEMAKGLSTLVAQEKDAFTRGEAGMQKVLDMWNHLR